MIGINIICVGKLKEKYLKDAVDEYKKRISRFAKFEITEIPDEKIPENASSAEMQKLLESEGKKILSAIKSDSKIIAMCIEGDLVSSEELANKIDRFAMQSGKITFIIGGSLGLSDSVKAQADVKISFGRITLPHQLMRVVLSEQIYRAFKINNNEQYHK